MSIICVLLFYNLLILQRGWVWRTFEATPTHPGARAQGRRAFLWEERNVSRPQGASLRDLGVLRVLLQAWWVERPPRLPTTTMARVPRNSSEGAPRTHPTFSTFPTTSGGKNFEPDLAAGGPCGLDPVCRSCQEPWLSKGPFLPLTHC